MAYRPDIVDCWMFRLVDGGAEVLLLRRAPGRILPGLWQCVSGSVESGERIVLAALRELAEETGFTGEAIDAFYDLDLVNQFHWPSVDGIVSSAVFAVRLGPDARPTLSHEHDAARWRPIDDAIAEVIWPGYRHALEVIRRDLTDPDRAPWFELTMSGERRLA
jgi:8-oxo-dGTP pyrophosphatase MutT (NUDIX family)